MGHPGQAAIVRNDEVTLHRVSNLHLPMGLFAGPVAAERNIRLCQESSIWDYAEGGVVIDRGSRDLLWYGADGPPYEWRAAAAEVLMQSWPGWRVQWTFEGVPALARRVGMRAPASSWAPPSDLPHAADGPPECLVTVRHSDGRLTAHAVGWEPREVLSYGPDVVPRLPDPLTADDLPVPTPSGGVHVDVRTATVGVWGRDAPGDTAAKWSDWTVQFWADDCAEHLRRIAGKPLFVPQLDWAYEAMRQSLIAARDGTRGAAPSTFLRDWYGPYFEAPVWDFTPSEFAMALAAVATAAGTAGPRGR